MMARWRLAATLLTLTAGASVALLGLSPVRAADHMDGPRATADTAADITDVYTFMSPETPTDIVFILNVSPFATSTSSFSSAVDYVFDVTPVTNPNLPDMIANANASLGTTLAIKCDYSAAAGGTMMCTGPGNLAVQVAIGDTGGGTVMGDSGLTAKLFAGPRSDPFFFDYTGFLQTAANPRTDAGADAGVFASSGNNFYKGKNVLSIVLEVDAAAVFGANDAGTPTTLLTVAAHTTRNGQ
jgi:Domain of unknown function (DUF4331)